MAVVDLTLGFTEAALGKVGDYLLLFSKNVQPQFED